MVVFHGMRLAIAGAAIGIAFAFALANFLASLPFRVPNPASFVCRTNESSAISYAQAISI
jgi:hypothetical protein